MTRSSVSLSRVTGRVNKHLTSESVQWGRSKWYSSGWLELLDEVRVDRSEPNGLMYRSSELALRRSGGKMVAGIVIPRIPTLSIEVDVPWNVFILGYARFALISPRFALKRKRWLRSSDTGTWRLNAGKAKTTLDLRAPPSGIGAAHLVCHVQVALECNCYCYNTFLWTSLPPTKTHTFTTTIDINPSTIITSDTYLRFLISRTTMAALAGLLEKKLYVAILEDLWIPTNLYEVGPSHWWSCHRQYDAKSMSALSWC